MGYIGKLAGARFLGGVRRPADVTRLAEMTRLADVRRREVLSSIAALLIAFDAVAHHSGAMFDETKSVTIAGTVKSFQWTNPHCWIQILVPGQQLPVEWSVEMGSPSQLLRGGWRPATLKAGDKVKIVIRPMRDGTNGGLFVSGTGADDQPIGGPAS